MHVQSSQNNPFAFSFDRGKQTDSQEKATSTGEAVTQEKSAAKKTDSPLSLTTEKLSLQDQKIVQDLKTRDRVVRAHEAAHLAAAGPYARGGASYSYQKGPDGKRYAIGGEVGIEASPVGNDPEATIRKARAVRRAANAPANPSAQDRRVASQAAAMEANERQELIQLQSEKIDEIGEVNGLGKTQRLVSEESTSEKPSQTQKDLAPIFQFNRKVDQLFQVLNNLGSTIDFSA